MNENKNPMSIDPWQGSLPPLQSPAINRRSLIALGGLIGLEIAGCGGGGGGVGTTTGGSGGKGGDGLVIIATF